MPAQARGARPHAIGRQPSRAASHPPDDTMDQRVVKNVRLSAIGRSSSIGRNGSQLEVGRTSLLARSSADGRKWRCRRRLFIVRSGPVAIIDEGLAGGAGRRAARRAPRAARRGDILDGLASLRGGLALDVGARTAERRGARTRGCNMSVRSLHTSAGVVSGSSSWPLCAC
jgi:hypothetical protein